MFEICIKAIILNCQEVIMFKEVNNIDEMNKYINERIEIYNTDKSKITEITIKRIN